MPAVKNLYLMLSCLALVSCGTSQNKEIIDTCSCVFVDFGPNALYITKDSEDLLTVAKVEFGGCEIIHKSDEVIAKISASEFARIKNHLSALVARRNLDLKREEGMEETRPPKITVRNVAADHSLQDHVIVCPEEDLNAVVQDIQSVYMNK